MNQSIFNSITAMTDKKINEMLNYSTYVFKKENTIGIYLVSVDKKSIQAECLERAQEMVGAGWQFIKEIKPAR